jgi:hypothetical protein
LYSSRSPKEQQEFDKRIEEMNELEVKRKELLPYIRYNFVHYRTDLFSANGLDPVSDQTILKI